jgi:hypothetical protein
MSCIGAAPATQQMRAQNELELLLLLVPGKIRVLHSRIPRVNIENSA